MMDELLSDPALDIAGNRLPNVLIDRTPRDLVALEAVRDLAGGLGPRDGVFIYHGGTRFSTEKLERILTRAPDAARSNSDRVDWLPDVWVGVDDWVPAKHQKAS